MNNTTWEFIEESLKLMKKQSDRLENATNGLMIAPESPLIDVYGRIGSRLLDALELLADDKGDTIHWFVYECDFGRNPMEAEVAGQEMVIDSCKALREFLEVVTED